MLGCLGLGFALLSVLSDSGFWTGVWAVLGVMLLALTTGQVLSVFSDRLRPSLVREELERAEPRLEAKRVLAGQHARDMQELTASIAHEIRNPVTAAKSLVQQMGEDPAAADNVEYASVALEELGRVERSISHLLRFAREEEVILGATELGRVVEDAVEAIGERARKHGVTIRTHLDAEGELRGDAEALRRVVLNLVGNAIEALSEAGTNAPTVFVEMGENLAGTELWLRVRDNGPGIPAADREAIFRPFHTSRENGTGLGLPITKKIVDAHGGTIEVDQAPEGGAQFLCTFPRGAERA